MECFSLLLEHLAWIKHQFLSGIRDSRKVGGLWGMMRGVGGVRKSIDQSWLVKGLGLLCWGFRGVLEGSPINLGIATSLGERKLWIQSLNFAEKNDLVSYPSHAYTHTHTHIHTHTHTHIYIYIYINRHAYIYIYIYIYI